MLYCSNETTSTKLYRLTHQHGKPAVSHRCRLDLSGKIANEMSTMIDQVVDWPITLISSPFTLCDNFTRCSVMCMHLPAHATLDPPSTRITDNRSNRPSITVHLATTTLSSSTRPTRSHQRQTHPHTSHDPRSVQEKAHTITKCKAPIPNGWNPDGCGPQLGARTLLTALLKTLMGRST